MSTSSHSISSYSIEGSVSRRRAVDRNLLPDVSDKSAEIKANETKPTSLGDTEVNPSRSRAKISDPNRKPKRPRWLTAIRAFTRILILITVILGLVQIVRWMRQDIDVGNFSVDFPGYSSDEFSEMKKFVQKSTNAIQLQMKAFERKLESEASSMKKEFHQQIVKQGNELDKKLKAMEARTNAFEKFMDELKKSVFSSKEFREFIEEFQKSRMNNQATLDDFQAYARDIAKNELEKHSADGLGMVDYALASAGGKIIGHSEPFIQSSGWLVNLKKISPEADRMLKPSFGEPGQCFPIKGTSGFVEIRLRAAIILEAFTLEHVSKMVAYDRSSAPKKCSIYGWFQGQDVDDPKKLLLAEFTYDLEKSNAQTFKVEMETPNVVDTIRLDVLSNHGSTSHTCIYRFRVHGREPAVLPAAALQS